MVPTCTCVCLLKLRSQPTIEASECGERLKQNSDNGCLYKFLTIWKFLKIEKVLF